MEGLIFGMLRYVMYCYPYTTLHRFRSLGSFRLRLNSVRVVRGGPLRKRRDFRRKIGL